MTTAGVGASEGHLYKIILIGTAEAGKTCLIT